MIRTPADDLAPAPFSGPNCFPQDRPEDWWAAGMTAGAYYAVSGPFGHGCVGVI